MRAITSFNDLPAEDLILSGDAARILDVAVETVRVYERQGLLAARRTARGIRLFSRREVERVARERRERQASRVSAPGGK